MSVIVTLTKKLWEKLWWLTVSVRALTQAKKVYIKGTWYKTAYFTLTALSSFDSRAIKSSLKLKRYKRKTLVKALLHVLDFSLYFCVFLEFLAPETLQEDHKINMNGSWCCFYYELCLKLLLLPCRNFSLKWPLVQTISSNYSMSSCWNIICFSVID